MHELLQNVVLSELALELIVQRVCASVYNSAIQELVALGVTRRRTA